MASLKLFTFDEALARSEGFGKRHLLLGNGFSRACREDIFAYGALFDRADFGQLSEEARRAFDVLGTRDFEVVMRALRSSSKLVTLYGASQIGVAESMQRDADGLREVLVHAIADSHPAWPGEIEPAAYSACRLFLSNFRSIYTVNYDLLLYWALMQTEIEPVIEHDDGFRTPDDGPEEYVTWEPEKTNRQNIFYLHGALHVFDAATEIQKFTWVNTEVRLIDQIRAALSSHRYPLFVAEGESAEKVERIKHSGFLERASRSFSQITGTLFAFGHSFAANDQHILRLIRKGKTQALYVSLFGNPESKANRSIRKAAHEISSGRPENKPLEVCFFDAESARVWG